MIPLQNTLLRTTQQRIWHCSKLERFYIYVVPQWYICINNITSLITQNHLRICSPCQLFLEHHTTPTLITEALCLVTYVQLTLQKLTAIRLVSTTCFNSKAIPTNDTDYSCHIHKSFRTHLTNHTRFISCLGGRNTHTHACTHAHTHTHNDFPDKSKI